jgi:hypothetical protein
MRFPAPWWACRRHRLRWRIGYSWQGGADEVRRCRRCFYTYVTDALARPEPFRRAMLDLVLFGDALLDVHRLPEWPR